MLRSLAAAFVALLWPVATTADVPWPTEVVGLSGAAVSPDGSLLTVISDRGEILQARIAREAGEITTLKQVLRQPLTLSDGAPVTAFQGDAEALALLQTGGLAVAFESFARIQIQRAPTARPRLLHRWDRFQTMFGNTGFEALVQLPDGVMLAVIEGATDADRGRTMAYDGRSWRPGPILPVTAGFQVSGADMGPDGCLYLLERRHQILRGFSMQIRRIGSGEDIVLDLDLPSANGEGLALWTGQNDTTRAIIVTDNGGQLTAKSLVLERDLPAAADCALTLESVN